MNNPPQGANNLHKIGLPVIVCFLVFPQVALGAWWNPFSWKIFRFDRPETTTIQEQKEEVGLPLDTAPASETAREENTESTNALSNVQQQGPYDVIKVVDGDTLTINFNGEKETIRLIGIDTPEVVDPRKPVQCFGVEASNKAKELLTNRRVSIETEASQGVRDKYGRLLAYVYREGGLFFNKYMIENGYAHEYTYNLPYKYQAEFKAAQRSAEVNQRGLWAPGVCEEKVVQPVFNQSSPAPIPVYQTQPVQPSRSVSGYSCSANIYNCGDFSTHNEAQSVYEMCGGVNNDIHRLDQDKDGEACESLP